MNILLLGSGGREHVFAWMFKKSPLCDQLFIAPGNAGTAGLGTNIAIQVDQFEVIKEVCLEEAIDMVVVGPEAPLVAGVYDYFKADADLRNIPVIGPSQAGAALEGSKAYAKAFMAEYDIPTAAYREFTQAELAEGLAYIDQQPTPIVLKADGLAAGKGVLIIEDREEAKAELKAMLDGKFGAASEKVVIEAFLSGIEFSVFALTDGKEYLILPVAKDYKRIGEGDTGLNTGGMGSVSPVPFVDDALMQKVEQRIIQPTIKGIQDRGLDYIGFVFFGLISVEGEPYVIEYNCRMGDPETQVVFPRMKNDLLVLLQAAHEGRLSEHSLEKEERAAAAVILVSGGYPEAYEKGKVITGEDLAEECMVFHAGTLKEGDQILTNGGRVLAVTSFGRDFKEALSKSYEDADKINFEGKYYRRDIGFDL
ncbi:MAG TPA: phosphoribosylamine--glycine ligase [Saprospiraceae bacterium]|nr:phosphoribosylamine--glycine ligase [Saprospiraceae bacterium]